MEQYAGIGSLKLSRYLLLQNVSEETKNRFLRIARFDLSLPQLDNLILEETARLKNENTHTRLARAFAFCSPNPAACTLLELAFLEYMDPLTNDALSMLFSGHEKGIRLLEAIQLTWPDEEYTDHIDDIIDAVYRLERVLLKNHSNLEPLLCHYRIDTELIAILQGKQVCSQLLDDCMEYIAYSSNLYEEIFHKKELEQMTAFIKKAEDRKTTFPILQVRGPELIGKRFLVRRCAENFKSDLMLVDFARFTAGNSEDFLLKKEALLRMSFLCDAMLCIYHVSQKEGEAYNRVVEFLEQRPIDLRAVFVTTTESCSRILLLKNPVLQTELISGNYEDNMKVWQGLSKQYLPDKQWDIKQLAGKLTLPIGMIKKVMQTIAFSPEHYQDIQEIFRLCYRLLEDEPDPSLKRVVTSYTMQQLKIDSRSKKILKNICSQIENRMQVFDGWQMRKLYPYGRCVSVLFTGPPGTGKTMAASVVANTVKLELYRVDLSQVVDKYVGETEKRLEKIFAHAEKSHCILFFDEADAIFGKRSELSDAKDRFANTQVSYLLQRIEAFDGIVILASNYRKNIDEAFIRRISYVIEFVNPDATIRKDIWKSLFLSSMEYEDIDLEYLANNFELTGAMIKNVVLKAAFFAVAEGCPLNMKHFLEAISQEYNKSGRNLKKEELGEYAYLI